jgi:hypothetical protein
MAAMGQPKRHQTRFPNWIEAHAYNTTKSGTYSKTIPFSQRITVNKKYFDSLKIINKREMIIMATKESIV